MRSSRTWLPFFFTLVLLTGLVWPVSVTEAHVNSAPDGGGHSMLAVATSDGTCKVAAAQHKRGLSPAVVAGSEFEVTAVFTAPADGFHAIGLSYAVPPGWEVSADVSQTDPRAILVLTPKPEEAVYVWAGPYDAGVEFTAMYTIRAPANAEPGLYTFGGSLEYYVEPYPAPSYVEAISGSIRVDAQAAPTSTIAGVVKEVDGSILPGATVAMYRNGQPVANAVTDEDGRYRLECPEPGRYDLAVTKKGFRMEVRAISVAELGETLVLDFTASSGLIPDAPGRPYVLACVSLWQSDDPTLQLSTSRLLDVISASKYPSR